MIDFAKVAIITRTKNRPLLLRRAASSVASQSFTDYLWVIVNDGGDVDVVREIVDAAGIDVTRVNLISFEDSHGMEAASNAGIQASYSDFLVIHDDDDSWDPCFLERTIAFLDGAQGARYGGVITQSLYVSEEIRGEEIIEHGRWPFQKQIRPVQIPEMIRGNFFPPISFLFRRSVYEQVGGYDASLPVLGDWAFNLEFLMISDIATLPESLAFYHHRDRGSVANGVYANSVIGCLSRHEEFAAVVRNNFLRRHSKGVSTALVATLGYIVGDLQKTLSQTGLRIVDSSNGSSASSSSRVVISHKAHADALDRYWTIAQINWILRRRVWVYFLRGKWLKALAPHAEWHEVLLALRKMKVTIPTPPDFDDKVYLEDNRDVAAAVVAKEQRSAYMHYIFFGRLEGRLRPFSKLN